MPPSRPARRLRAARVTRLGKSVAGVFDAVWLARVTERQMISPSFVLPPAIRRLLDLTDICDQVPGPDLGHGIPLPLMPPASRPTAFLLLRRKLSGSGNGPLTWK